MRYTIKYNFYADIILLFSMCFIRNAFADVCKNGYEVLSYIASDTFSPVYKGVCETGYKKYEFISSNIYPIFQKNDCVLGERSAGDGVCVDLVQGECKNNYFDITTAETTMQNMSKGVCETGYTKQEFLSRLAFYVVSENTHCGAGYHPTGDGSCVAWPTDGCEVGQYAYGGDSVMVRPLFDKTCASGYTPYHVFERVCFGGEVRTFADTCSPLCNKLNMHTFHAGNLSVPLYDTKTTEHAIVVGNPENKCYLNLLPGRQKGTINVGLENEIYHAVD